MEKITLKKLVNHNNKWAIILLMTGIFMAFYGVCGAISYQSGVILPFIPGEESIPLMPWTVLVYIVLYPAYLIWCMKSFEEEESMNKLLFSFSLLTLISCVIFLLFPVNYPRHLYPLPLDNDPITLLMRAVRSVDKPSNCLPSLHVGLCYIFGLWFYRESKKRFWISMGISTLVAISTLTTKQHYIYDILVGFSISFGLWVFFDRLTEIKA